MRGKAIYSLGGAILQLLMRLMRFSLGKFVERLKNGLLTKPYARVDTARLNA